MMKKLFFCLFVLLTGQVSAQIIEIDSIKTLQQICSKVGFAKIERFKIDESVENVQVDFSTAEVHNLGLSNDVFLLRLVLTSNSNIDKEYIVELVQPTLDSVLFYVSSEKNNLTTLICDNTPIQERIIKNQNPSIPISLNKNRLDTIYIQLKSGEQLLTPIRIGCSDAILQINHAKDTLFGVFFGIMFALILYNFFIYFRTKDPIYGFYIVYLLIIFITQSNVQGYTIWIFDGILSSVERHLVYSLTALSGITGLIFIYRYLEIPKYAPRTGIIFKVAIAWYALAMIFSYFNFFNIAYQSIIVVGSLIGPAILCISYLCYRHGNSGALSLLFAWTVFFIGVLIFALKDFGILPYNDWTQNTMTVGSAIEGILLSFGLADKINILKREKEEAQVRELETLKLSETRLEEQVRERTHELQEAKEHIEVQYHNLQRSQRQLIESEKMAGLGQMTAGIAHELNNPINFVSSNVDPLERDVEEVLEILNDVRSLPLEPTSPELESIRTKIKNYDVPLLEAEIKMLLSGIKEGSSRASDIVSGLRIFARADQEVFVNANVNDCVNATLVLIKSTWKNEVTLLRSLDEQLPNIDCLPGKLNQVIVNLITNAVQASIEHHQERSKRQIEVQTSHDEDFVYLRVKDNGPGIPVALQNKIFEPFFTTKKVGQGTGLGLSISKSIVDDHEGSLKITSEIDCGTEFLVTLPRKKSTLAQAA
jgi:two-component system, NtrC family, sensor kinase